MNQKSISITPAFKASRSQRHSADLSRKILFNLLSKATRGGLVIREGTSVVAEFGSRNAELQAEINVLDTRCYARALLGGDVGAGEAFVQGWWTTPDIADVTRFFSRNLDMMDAWCRRFGWLMKPLAWLRLLTRLNSRRQAKRNILAHYDLGNELYQRFLDPAMQYSSALYKSANCSLEQAQQHKLQRLCEQLQLESSDHLLEIGSGWGGLAMYAARNYGCQVTTTTISEQQYAHAQKWIQQEGLQEKITLLKQDYRDLEGQFDKLVSVEMIEAVGKAFLPQYFRQLDRLVKPGGLVMIQAITVADQRLGTYQQSEDFIQKHIFPGGFLPSLQMLSELIASQSELIIRDIHDMGLDYAKTLRDWRDRFLSRYPELEKLGYDEQFQRLWEYYLGYCEGGFLERRISTVQLLASKAPHHPY